MSPIHLPRLKINHEVVSDPRHQRQENTHTWKGARGARGRRARGREGGRRGRESGRRRARGRSKERGRGAGRGEGGGGGEGAIGVEGREQEEGEGRGEDEDKGWDPGRSRGEVGGGEGRGRPGVYSSFSPRVWFIWPLAAGFAYNGEFAWLNQVRSEGVCRVEPRGNLGKLPHSL